MGNFFDISNFSCGYDKTFHLSEITVSVAQGSFVGIIGPNGCGKTTLMRGITGELRTEAGTITLKGRSLERMSHKEKARNMAIVTQDIDIPDMTVEESVLMGRLPYHTPYQFFDTDEDVAIAERYMQLTNVSHLRTKYMHQLSGGERQMIAITRALVQEPELLLLDEPTSHLDITHQVEVLNLVQRLNEELRLTVLMIIHDLNLAGEYCDQLVLMNQGRVQLTGPPEEVLTYDTIEKVYGTVVVTKPNPLSGKPVIFLVSQKILEAVKKKRQ